jgi:hypothetical protein
MQEDSSTVNAIVEEKIVVSGVWVFGVSFHVPEVAALVTASKQAPGQ